MSSTSAESESPSSRAATGAIGLYYSNASLVDVVIRNAAVRELLGECRTGVLKPMCGTWLMTDGYRPFSGGAVYSYYSYLAMTNSRIDGATALSGGSGGAVYSEGGNTDIRNSNFTGCRAVNAGAFHLEAVPSQWPAGGRHAMSNVVLTQCQADASGGGIRLVDASLRMAAVSLVANAAGLSGGSLLAEGASAVTADGCTLEGSRAAFGGGVAVSNSSSVQLRGSRVMQNFATNSGGAFSLQQAATVSVSAASRLAGNRGEVGGGIAFVRLGAAQPTLDPSTIILSNTAGRWGSMTASDGFILAVDLGGGLPSAVAAPSEEIPTVVTIRDRMGQPVEGLPGSIVSVSCPQDPGVLGRAVANPYDAAGARVAGVRVSGVPGSVFTLVFSVSAPSLPAPVNATATVTLRKCGLLENFNDETKSCDCASGSTREASTGRCLCSEGLHLFTRAAVSDGAGGNTTPAVGVCTACPSTGATCIRGLLAPMEGFWHSRWVLPVACARSSLRLPM